MVNVPIRELRNHGGEVMDRVAAGEDVVVTHAGKAVARIIPFRSRRIGSAGLLERWRNIPLIDGDALRTDLAEIIDEAL